MKKIKLIRKLDALISNENTGDRKQLAKKLDISIPTLYRLIQEMKDDFGAPIVYCNKQYIYAKSGKLHLEFEEFNGDNINF